MGETRLGVMADPPPPPQAGEQAVRFMRGPGEFTGEVFLWDLSVGGDESVPQPLKALRGSRVRSISAHAGRLAVVTDDSVNGGIKIFGPQNEDDIEALAGITLPCLKLGIGSEHYVVSIQFMFVASVR